MVGRAKLGIALGSGSARGWAHIGVLRALTEQGIALDFITAIPDPNNPDWNSGDVAQWNAQIDLQ